MAAARCVWAWPAWVSPAPWHCPRSLGTRTSRFGPGADPRQVARDAFAAEFQGARVRIHRSDVRHPDLDAIHILTPNRLHAEHAIVAAEHGKQVILDKPLAVSLAEADRVIAAVEHNGVRLIVGHTQSLDVPIRRMAEIVASGALGRPRTITTLFFSDWLYRPRSLDDSIRHLVKDC